MPFGDKCQYKTFGDCVKAHSDKDDPHAYCATIQDATEKHCARAQRIELRRQLLNIRSIRQAVDDTYEWDDEKKQYLRDGVAVSLGTLWQIRDQLTDAQYNDADDLTDQLAEDGDLEQWQRDMRTLIVETHTAAYLLGNGGANMFDAASHAIVGALITSQFQYLQRFAQTIKDDGLSADAIKARSEQYMSAATYAFSRGQADLYADLELPCMPCDGNTACLMNCRCGWDIEEDDKEWRAYWQSTGDDLECSDCDQRATSYSPYVQTKPKRADIAA